MKHFQILMDKINDDASPSGYGAETTTTSETTETAQTQGNTNDTQSSNDTSNSQGTQNQTSNTDDKSKQNETSEQGTKDLTGYTTTETEKLKDEGNKPADEKKPLELDAKGLDDASVNEIKATAERLGLTQEQAQKMLDTRIEQDKAHEVEVQKAYGEWEKELKNDPDFGGQNFANSVHNVNRLINEMPGLKNMLTGSGKRLPPILMKDLNSVAKRLYGETEFNGGERNSGGKEWHPTDYYKTSKVDR